MFNEEISPEQTKDKNLYLNKFINGDVNLRKTPPEKVNQDIRGELRNEIKNISWKDINFKIKKGQIQSKFYYVVLPPKLEELRKLIVNSDLSGDEKNNYNVIKIKSEETFNFNRTHFENALPKDLLGVGFGYKIYKALAHKLGYISSNFNASPSAQNVWGKLVQDSDFNVIITNEVTLLIVKNYPKKIELVKNFLEDVEIVNLDSENVLIDTELVSQL